MIRRMKALVVLTFLVGCFSFTMASPASAAFSLFGDACESNSSATVCQDARNSGNPLWGSGSVVELIVNILSLIIGVAAVIVIIIAGIQYMLSTGDPTKVNNAKNAILYALVGLVVAVLARFLVNFVVSRL